MSDFLDVGALDDEARSALRRHVTSLADSKRLMGIRWSDWLLGSPSIETGIATSSMAQDEWGHARLLYSMLKELGDDPVRVEHDRAAEAYASMSPLDAPFPDWAAVVAGMVVLDGALTCALDAFSRGRFEPATTRCPKMLAEEEFHRALADAWFARLARSGAQEARDLLRWAVERTLPPTLRWLDPADAAAGVLRDSGVLPDDADPLGDFRDRVRDQLALIGVEVDRVEPASGWDEGRGRAPGQPDDESIERARGDRNRALFVE